MARARTSKASIEKAQKQEQILNLRLAGASIRSIAEKLKIPKSTVQRYAEQAINEVKREPAELVVDMELQRLDALLLGVWKDAVTGDTKAISAALRIMERRAKYMNLDNAAPPDTSGEARKALDEMMAAIRSSHVDIAEVGRAAIAPGAVPASVFGPDNTEDEPPLVGDELS